MTKDVDTEAPTVTLEIGQWVDTRRHGGGYVRGLSHTTPELTSVDIELVDGGETLGWVVLPLSEIVEIADVTP